MMMSDLSMQETKALLTAMQVQAESIINSMNPAQAGGFENSMLTLRDNILDASSLLQARIYGQLSQEPPGRTLIDNRPADKPLANC
jgi:hypothetical protein